MVYQRWTHSNTCIYNINYHLIWCPKYRRAILTEEVAKRLTELLIFKSNEIGVIIDTLEIMPDHVHLFIKAKPIASPHWIIQQLKGYTSNKLRNEFASLKSKLPTLWTRSYYCESVGHISQETVKKYIQDQKGK